jgi:hypothetical protein
LDRSIRTELPRGVSDDVVWRLSQPSLSRRPQLNQIQWLMSEKKPREYYPTAARTSVSVSAGATYVCRRAAATNARNSATIRSFSSRLQRRRRSTDVINLNCCHRAMPIVTISTAPRAISGEKQGSPQKTLTAEAGSLEQQPPQSNSSWDHEGATLVCWSNLAAKGCPVSLRMVRTSFCFTNC